MIFAEGSLLFVLFFLLCDELFRDVSFFERYFDAVNVFGVQYHNLACARGHADELMAGGGEVNALQVSDGAVGGAECGRGDVVREADFRVGNEVVEGAGFQCGVVVDAATDAQEGNAQSTGQVLGADQVDDVALHVGCCEEARGVGKVRVCPVVLFQSIDFVEELLVGLLVFLGGVADGDKFLDEVLEFHVRVAFRVVKHHHWGGADVAPKQVVREGDWRRGEERALDRGELEEVARADDAEAAEGEGAAEGVAALGDAAFGAQSRGAIAEHVVSLGFKNVRNALAEMLVDDVEEAPSDH